MMFRLPAWRILSAGNFIVAGIFALSLPLLAQTSLEKGVRLFENGQLAEARQFFESMVKEDPYNAVVAFYLGQVFFAAEDYDRAVEWFERAVELEGNNSEYHLWLGRGYGYKAMRASIWRQFFLARKVKAHFEKAVALDPDNTAARLDLVEYYVKAPSLVGGSREKAYVQAEEIKKRDVERGREAEELIAEAEGRKQHARNE